MFMLFVIVVIAFWCIALRAEKKGYDVDKIMDSFLGAVLTILILPVSIIAGLLKNSK